MVKQTHSMNWKQKFLALAIAIVTVSFIFTAIYMVYERPSYEDNCNYRALPVEIDTAEQCQELEGEWIAFEGAPSEIRSEGYCDLYSECDKEYQVYDTSFRKRVFIVALIAGLGVLIGGIFVPISAVSAGLMGGGLLTLFFGIVQYWDELANVLRLIILGIALAVLIYIGVKKLK
jgi:hypothetical protein